MSSALARCRCRSSALSAFCDDDHRKHLCDAYSLVDGAFFLRYYYSIVSHFMKKTRMKMTNSWNSILEYFFCRSKQSKCISLSSWVELLFKLFQKTAMYRVLFMLWNQVRDLYSVMLGIIIQYSFSTLKMFTFSTLEVQNMANNLLKEKAKFNAAHTT